MAFASDNANLGEDGFADSGGVKIHYVIRGAGPLVVLTHGIPGFWFNRLDQQEARSHVFPSFIAYGEEERRNHCPS
jgi:pimeloyl-ACP methyl ester carboxylesterase